MINPPFPYQAVILRKAAPSSPFEDVDENAVVVYDGECDFEANHYPTVKNGVQVAKYKLYLPDNTVDVQVGDAIKLSIFGKVRNGVVADVFPTNFGLTVSWDNTNN